MPIRRFARVASLNVGVNASTPKVAGPLQPEVTHAECNRLLAEFSVLGDLHPGNVVVTGAGVIVVEFAVSNRHRPHRLSALLSCNE